MRKKFLYGLAASISMVSIGAYAEDANNTALTTKGYVDAGLKYVYDAAKGDISNLQNALSDGNGGLIDVGDLANTVGTAGTGENPGTGLVGAVEGLQDTVGDSTDGLVKDVADLQTAVGDANNGLIKKVNDLESSSIVYTPGDGIKVTPGATSSDPSTIELDIENVQNNTTYVFKTDGTGNGTWQAMEIESTWNDGDFESLLNP